jgi:hypothetical protein
MRLILDILKAARFAIEFKGHTDKTEFLADAKTHRPGVITFRSSEKGSSCYLRNSDPHTQKFPGS